MPFIGGGREGRREAVREERKERDSGNILNSILWSRAVGDGRQV